MSNVACMNHMYYGEKDGIKDILASTGYILLNNALNNEAYSEIARALKNMKFTENIVADTHSFSAGKPVEAIVDVMREIKDFIAMVTQRELRIKRVTVRKFKEGDYYLQHTEKPEAGINVVLFFVGKWSPEFRGEYTYMFDQPLFFYPENNTLAIIWRGENTRRFVKKVSYHAGKTSFIAVEAVFEQ